MDSAASSREIPTDPLDEPEDILAAAVKQDDSRVLEHVLDVILSTLHAESAVLVREQPEGRSYMGRSSGSSRLKRPIDHVDEVALRRLMRTGQAVYSPPSDLSQGRWSLTVPVRESQRTAAALFLEGKDVHGEKERAAPERLRSIGRLAALAMLVDDLDCRLRKLRENLRKPTPGEEKPPRQDSPSSDPAAGTRISRNVPLRSVFPEIVAESPAMRAVLSTVADLAPSEIPVLVEGESGTGKELIAVAIHRLSPRSTGPFVTENCGAIPDSLVEAEFFGYEKGAFTGADRARTGILERAHTGTLFLDEIGEMALDQQKKLLRVLQERKVRRIGGRADRNLEFRLVCATNKVLEELVAQGRFREDLYYRLNGAVISLPPLDHRREDIPVLTDRFNRQFSQDLGQKPLRFRDDTVEKLRAYHWPGNVRELRHEIWRLVTSVRDEACPYHLSKRINAYLKKKEQRRDQIHRKSLDELEKEVLGDVIRDSLERTGGNVSRAAEYLGVARATLYRRMRRFGISPEKKPKS